MFYGCRETIMYLVILQQEAPLVAVSNLRYDANEQHKVRVMNVADSYHP